MKLVYNMMISGFLLFENIALVGHGRNWKDEALNSPTHGMQLEPTEVVLKISEAMINAISHHSLVKYSRGIIYRRYLHMMSNLSTLVL